MQKLIVSRHKPAWLAVLLSATATVSLALPAYSQQPGRGQDPAAGTAARSEPLFQVRSKRSDLKIVERFAKVVELQTKIKRVDGFDPEIVEVSALTPNRIRVQAVTTGITTLVLVDEKEQMYSIDVFVTGDVRHLQAYLDHFFPNASIEAVEVADSVVLRGWVSQPEHINELVEVAEQFYPKVINQVRVGGVQQVQLTVKVMEVQRSKIQNLGFNWFFLNQDVAIGSTPGALTPLTALTAPFGGPPAVTYAGIADPTIALGIMNPNSIFLGFLEALKQEGLLKIMAEPVLVTTNGRPAELLTGGEFPIPVPQSLGTVTIEWKEYGTRMNFCPVVLGAGRVRLEVEAEVSELDLTRAIEVGGTDVPGLTTRKVNTQTEMKLGQTWVIAGLIVTRDVARNSKIPVLGDLPWIGTAFSRKRYEESETELVVMVTPEFVGPLDPGQVLEGGPGLFTDRPNFRELWDGMIEVPKYGDGCEGCGAPGMDPVVPDGSPGTHGIVPDGPGGGVPALPPAPAPNDQASSSRKSPQGFGRFNPFRRRTDREITTGSGIRQTTGSRRDGSSGRLSNADYESPEDRIPYVQHAVGQMPNVHKPRARAQPGLIEPQSELIKP